MGKGLGKSEILLREVQKIMTEIINLNKKRKAKKLVEKEVKASENRIKFGRTKAEKDAEKLKKQFAERELKGKKLEKNDE